MCLVEEEIFAQMKTLNIEELGPNLHWSLLYYLDQGLKILLQKIVILEQTCNGYTFDEVNDVTADMIKRF